MKRNKVEQILKDTKVETTEAENIELMRVLTLETGSD